jgi:pyruvate/2-oxoglutarate dehydrogenase complex dihydrolipoamide dehydrogenase (E3) component
MPDTFDAIIIGSGQGGSPLAGALAGAGWRTALVERRHVGGTCVNDGCTPTKTLIASARAAHVVARSGDFGVEGGPAETTWDVVRRRKRDIVQMFREGSEKRLVDTGVELIRGTAAFTAPHELTVQMKDGGERKLAAETIVIDTGARPLIPPITGLGDVPYLDSTSIMELDTLPQHLIVLGGGYVGLEFAQMFRRFGRDVTIVQRGPQLLEREDADVAEAVHEILREDGITLHLSAEATAVRGKAGDLNLMLDTSAGETTIGGSHLLVATGRKPNTDELALAAAGIEADDRGFVRVNEHLETTVSGVYAVGDVKGGPQFTHISYDDFRVLQANLLDGGVRTTAGRLVPYTVFIDPQLGRIGLSEQGAQSAGKRVRVARMPMTHSARALEIDETRGMMKAVIDADTDRVLGAAILGPEGGEVAAMIQIAMLGGLTASALRDGVFSHPTLAESLNTLFASIDT